MAQRYEKDFANETTHSLPEIGPLTKDIEKNI
jgi:hypothetical protein